MSSTAVSTTSLLHNIFDQVSGDESADGDTEYRVIYIRNNHASLSAQNVKVYLSANPNDDIELGVNEAANTNAQSLSNESTAPSGVTFANRTSAAKLDMGNIPHTQFRALYLKRTIAAGTAADDDAEFTIEIQTDTAE